MGARDNLESLGEALAAVRGPVSCPVARTGGEDGVERNEKD